MRHAICVEETTRTSGVWRETKVVRGVLSSEITPGLHPLGLSGAGKAPPRRLENGVSEQRSGSFVPVSSQRIVHHSSVGKRACDRTHSGVQPKVWLPVSNGLHLDQPWSVSPLR
jgi:hypothetical protein